jgi:hypothetical protein
MADNMAVESMASTSEDEVVEIENFPIFDKPGKKVQVESKTNSEAGAMKKPRRRRQSPTASKGKTTPKRKATQIENDDQFLSMLFEYLKQKTDKTDFTKKDKKMGVIPVFF